MNFNSHAHVERDRKDYARSGNSYNFNSHAHVERDYEEKQSGVTISISTHTLTWSVTCGRLC